MHPTENLAAYVLGALEGPEGISVEAHVATCATCGSVVEQYRAVASALPMGLDPVALPPEAWAAIRAKARQGRPPADGWAKTGVRPLWRLAMWPVLTTLVASLLVWNVVLQRELTRRAPGPAPGPEVEALSRRPGRLVILAGTGQPAASARLFVAVDGGGHLAISGLTPLPGERTYQLWFIRRRVHHSDRRHLQGRLARPGVGQGHCPGQSRRDTRHCRDRGAGSGKREPDGSSPSGI